MKYVLIILYLSTGEIRVEEQFDSYEACEMHASEAWELAKGSKKSWMCASVSSDLLKKEAIKEFANPVSCKYSIPTLFK